MYIIYALSDPRTNTVRYVGHTNDIHRRYAEHLLSRGRKNPMKIEWISELRSANVLPALIVLESNIDNEQDAYAQEMFWMSKFLPAENLTNVLVSKHEVEPRVYHQELATLTALPKDQDTLWRQIRAALRDLGIVSIDGCVTTKDAARILSWRAKAEQGIETTYRESTLRKHVYNGTIKPARLTAGHSFYRLEDLFGIFISPRRGSTKRKDYPQVDAG